MNHTTTTSAIPTQNDHQTDTRKDVTGEKHDTTYSVTPMVVAANKPAEFSAGKARERRETVRTLWAYSIIATVSLLVLLAAGAAMFERPDAFGMMMKLFAAYTAFSGVVTGFYFKNKSDTNDDFGS